jgi:hypothetical protein
MTAASHAAAVVALLALFASAACTSDSAEVCPGVPVATLAFTGARVFTPARLGGPGPLDPALDPDPTLPDCDDGEGGLGHSDPLAPFSGSVSNDPATGTAALCRAADRAQPLYGTLLAGRLAVETATEGAVLGGSCGAGCVATLALSIRGTFSGTAPSLRLDGAAVERLGVRAGATCGPAPGCLLPCAARYAVTGLPAAP